MGFLMPGSGLGFAVIEVLLSVAAMALFFYLVYVRIIRLLRQGQAEVRWDRIPDRVIAVLVNVFGQKKLLLDRKSVV